MTSLDLPRESRERFSVNKPSPFGVWLRHARIKARLSQTALSKAAKLHRLQITYLENGRTALPRADARERLYAALGEHAPQQAITDSTRAGLGEQPCSFCGAEVETTWFMATSPLKPGICICAYCVMSANQQAAAVAREHVSEEIAASREGESLTDW